MKKGVGGSIIEVHVYARGWVSGCCAIPVTYPPTLVRPCKTTLWTCLLGYLTYLLYMYFLATSLMYFLKGLIKCIILYCTVCYCVHFSHDEGSPHFSPQTSSLPLAVQDSWTTTGTHLLHCCVSNMDPSLPGASLSSCHCGCCYCCCCCVETTKGGVGKSPSITRGGRLVEHFAVQSLMDGWGFTSF